MRPRRDQPRATPAILLRSFCAVAQVIMGRRSLGMRTVILLPLLPVFSQRVTAAALG